MAADASPKKSQPTHRTKAQSSALNRIREAKAIQLSPVEWAKSIAQCKRDALGQAITLTESHREQDAVLLKEILNELHKLHGIPETMRIGITGVPGVGKSTFIERFGHHLIRRGHRVAVLAIDPSSERSGGSVMGDKTRMETLTQHPDAFIRPSPTANALGGVAQGTHEAILLCEYAGFDRIIVETVGVGQSETAVRELTDAFVLLMLPGGGDELQGIKRGIMEMADLMLVNKCDGAQITLARETAQHYQKALHLFPPNPGEHSVQVHTVSAELDEGIEGVCDALNALKLGWVKNEWFDQQRAFQRGRIFEQHMKRLMLMQAGALDANSSRWHEITQSVQSGAFLPLQAAWLWLNENSAS